jgi:hypothetical protein
MADEDTGEREVVERREATERRVYALPATLLARLRAYQESQGLASEAEAARRLLDMALQLRDGMFDILKSLQVKFLEEKDLRVVASEVLIKHALVTKVSFESGWLEFRMQDGDRGRMGPRGNLSWVSSAFGENEDWMDWPPKQKPVSPPAAPSRSGGPSWEAPSSDLDDEIPF